MINVRPLFENVMGSTIVTLDTNTDARLTGGKKNPHKGLVRKLTEGLNTMLFNNRKSNGYDSMVKRRLEKEGKNPETFELSPRKWGSRIPNLPIVEHKGEYYLEVISLRPGSTRYEIDGSPINKSDVIGLPIKKEGEQGGLDDKVIIRTFKLSSITRMAVGGREYTGEFYFQ